MEKSCSSCRFSGNNTEYDLCNHNPDSPTYKNIGACGLGDTAWQPIEPIEPIEPIGITIREPTKHEPKDFSNQDHYTRGSIEPWDYIIANNLDFLEGNVVKYIKRHKYKGTQRADLEKIKVCVNKILEGLDD